MFDILPQDAAWGHAMAHDADGLELHYVRRGQESPTVLLLHGWPGFWYDWRRVLLSSWADRLEEYFPHLVGVQMLAGIGHFVPFEAHDAFVEAIRTVL